VLSTLPTRPPSSAQPPASATALDVSTVKVGSRTTVTELDLGTLKGNLRQLGWSPDGTELYVQTADGTPPSEKLRHYTVAVAGGAVKPVDRQPDWAATFWAFKSDRAAPGIESLMIDVEQKVENMKYGTGSAGAADRTGSALGGGNVVSSDNVDRAAQSQHVNVARLKLFDEAISEFFNERPIPGLMFSWGPAFSGAIAYTDRDGRLILLDQNKHKQTVSGTKDALLPAWSIDGSRLAWVQKSGRKKYTLVWAPVSKG
jgi:hypothetical protein